MKDTIVVKRNGSEEEFQFDKILKHLKDATKDFKNVDINEIIANLKLRMKPKMRSEEIQQALIQSAADLISSEKDEYNYVAARLLLQDLYKDIYGNHNPKFNYDTLLERIKKGYYADYILDYYTKDEINELAKIIDFRKDLNFTYSGLKQMLKKYGVKRNDKVIETPQEIFFLIPLYNFYKIKNKKERLYYIKNTYKALSNFKIFLSTPPLVGIRTQMRGWTSCAGVNWGDSIDAFGKASLWTFKLITKLRAGIGSYLGGIRGLGADIADGFEKHTGIIPYAKVNEAITRSSTQPNSGRSGSATDYYPFFHWEIEEILQLKNNKGSDETSVRFSDHAIIFDELFYERLEQGKDITLFHINDVKDLHELIGTPEFKKKYEEFERKRSIEKRKIKAEDLYKKYFNERYQTARIYKVNANEFQKHSAFKIPTFFSNLCTEINLPAFPDDDFVFKVKNKKEYKKFINKLYEEGKWYQLYRFFEYDIIDEKNKKIVQKHKSYLDSNGQKFIMNFGEIFSCILGGINIGILPLKKEKRIKEIGKLMDILVRFLDEMIDNQDYVGIKPFEKFTKNRRALGISPGNMFYLLARMGYDYNTVEARNLMHEIMEEMLYFGLEASNKLAQKKGKCKFFADTKYSDAILPIDTYNKNVDKLHNKELTLNWDLIREKIKKYGLRNSTILTVVPSSNSSRPANMISGINPPQSLEPVIEDNRIKVPSLLPGFKKYKEFYKRNLAWSIDVIEYWKLVAVIQKFVDQAISLNEYVDYSKYENEQIPYSDAVKRDFFTRKYGLKTLYYAKSKTQNDLDMDLNDEEETNCIGGGCHL